MRCFPAFFLPISQKKPNFEPHKEHTKKMKGIYIVCLALAAAVCVSCKKKVEPPRVITKVSAPKVSHETRALPPTSDHCRFTWASTPCSATITRSVDDSKTTITDDDGNKYYDNAITVAISGPSGAIVSHTFHKSDFAAYMGTHFVRPTHSTLISLAFRDVSDGKAVFIATVGSPDERDDEYVLVEVSIARNGAIATTRVEEIE